jgi:hypothetical protein
MQPPGVLGIEQLMEALCFTASEDAKGVPAASVPYKPLNLNVFLDRLSMQGPFEPLFRVDK